MRNKVAMYLAIVAGMLLLGMGVTGVATWRLVSDFFTSLLGDNQVLVLFFQVLIFISSLGGLAVIFGGVLIGARRVFIGKLLIMLGAGVGLFGFLVMIVIPWVQQGGSTLTFWTSAGTIGIVLSIAARMIAK